MHEAVNRFGNVLQDLGVRMEERVAMLLPDSPEWVYVFFGAIKIGAVAIPLNTLLASKDYEYLLNDSRARVLVVHAAMMDRIAPIRDRLRYLEQVIVVDGKADGGLAFEALMERSSAMLDPGRYEQGRHGLLAVQLGNHGVSQGGDPPAP